MSIRNVNRALGTGTYNPSMGGQSFHGSNLGVIGADIKSLIAKFKKEFAAREKLTVNHTLDGKLKGGVVTQVDLTCVHVRWPKRMVDHYHPGVLIIVG